jgi:HK97 family phage major capsid protein
MKGDQIKQRLGEIEQRMTAISTEVETDGADLDALETEIRSLRDERAKLHEDIKAELLRGGGETVDAVKETRAMNEITNASPEYRNAWLKNFQGKELDEAEKRALTASAAMPEGTVNKIVDIMVDMVPLLSEIELFRLAGNINVPVETVSPAATQEATGGAVTESTATLRQVALGGYNMNAFIRIGADLAQMAVPAFEDWLTRKLAEAIAHKIEDMTVNGNGSSAPKGIDYYVTTWDVSDGTGVAWTGSSGSALALADIDTAIGNVPAAYDRESKFLMSKKTFFKNVSSLTDTNNWPVITKEGNTFFLRGYPVVFSDKVAANVIFFGSLKRGMVGNLSSDVKVEKQRNLAYNAWDILGWGVYDCEPAAAGCIVKIASGIQS